MDDIIMKHNKENNYSNLYSFSKKPFNSNFEQLLDFFSLDKDLFSGDNIVLENEESFNYEKAFNEYPQIKTFIELLVKKYKNEKKDCYMKNIAKIFIKNKILYYIILIYHMICMIYKNFLLYYQKVLLLNLYLSKNYFYIVYYFLHIF